MATLGSSASPSRGSSGDPGSAFSGLSRGRGRGRGGAGGGGRGGRGRARGGLSPVDTPGTKPDNCRSSTSPSTKSSILPALSPTFSSKPKSAARRGSHAISVVPQIDESGVTSSVSTLTPAKFTYKRRRSQAGKPIDVPPKANLHKLTDSPLRPNKLHIESHTETLKDLPPHLNSKFDVRHDIDALVERVRAVAMDNRPSTPKSHIDWAVDDDDTLPDLDDWGVTTSTLTTQMEGISPIIVDGLRSLPDFAANSTVPNPLKQAEAVLVQPTFDAQSSPVNNMAPNTVVPVNAKEENTKSKFSPESTAKHERRTIPLNPKLRSSQLNSNTLANSLSVDPIVQRISKSRPGASPMRFAPNPKSPIISVVDLSERSPLANLGQVGAGEPVEITFEMTNHKTATMFKGSDRLTVVEPIVTESVISNVSPDRGTDQTQTAQEPSPSSLSGLSASMHAPKGIVDSVSAPANLSTYADPHAHHPIHSHMRAHTVGRSPLSDSTMYRQGDHMTRVTRSGHTTPKGGFQGTGHARTHSTPPGGVNHRAPHTSRPVITGDAISRLARTIGKTHNKLSPPTSHSAVTSDRPAS